MYLCVVLLVYVENIKVIIFGYFLKGIDVWYIWKNEMLKRSN